MPCTDGGVPYPPSREELLDKKVPSAMLCALLSVGLPSGMLEQIDWDEAGITRAEFTEWWQRHRAQDVVRRAAEQRTREREELRRLAEAKLTPEELAAIRSNR
jgi:hypothetical protein